MTWEIWSLKPETGDKAYLVDRFENRGHAIARLRGLRRAAWRAGSEAEFGLCRGLS